MLPPTSSRRLAVLGGFLWLALAFMLFLVGVLYVAVAGPLALIPGAMGVTALAHSAILFTQAATRRMLIASAIIGLLSTLVGLWASRSDGSLSGLTLSYTALSVLATIVSVTAAFLASSRR